VKTERIVVRFDVPLTHDDLANLNDPQFWTQGIESMRRQATALAQEAGGRLHPTQPPRFTQPITSSHATFGGNWLLWASMWYVEVPESFVMPTSGQDSPDQPFVAS
jgi:hypothetical protein